MTRMHIPNDCPVELTPPDISAYRMGNTGIDYVHRIASDRPGPHVGITAIVHGNEPCGAIALDWLLRHDIRLSAARSPSPSSTPRPMPASIRPTRTLRAGSMRT